MNHNNFIYLSDGDYLLHDKDDNFICNTIYTSNSSMYRYRWIAAMSLLLINNNELVESDLYSNEFLDKLFKYSYFWDSTKSITEQYFNTKDIEELRGYLDLLDSTRLELDRFYINTPDKNFKELDQLYDRLNDLFITFLSVLRSLDFENPGFIKKYFPDLLDISTDNRYYCKKIYNDYKTSGLGRQINRYSEGVTNSDVLEYIKYINTSKIKIEKCEKESNFYAIKSANDIRISVTKNSDHSENYLMYDEIFPAFFQEILLGFDEIKSEKLMNYILDLKKKLILPKITTKDMSDVIDAIIITNEGNKDVDIQWAKDAKENNILNIFFEHIEDIKNLCLYWNIKNYTPHIIRVIYTAIYQEG